MPQQDSFAKCGCQHCGGHIEFPVQCAGQKINCPHCNWPTTLTLPAAPVEVGGGRAGRKKTYTIFSVAAFTVALAGAATLYFFKPQNPAPANPPSLVAVAPAPSVQPSNGSVVITAPVPASKPKPPPDPWHGLMASKVALEKSEDGRLVYAVGTLTNATERQRFGVKIELEAINKHREKVGSATDYTDVIEPGKAWKFRAMVTDKNATGAKLTSVKEQE